MNESLDQKYLDELRKIKDAIQDSELLSVYLDEEEDADYRALTEAFEPAIQSIYEVVAANDPLQLESFETELLDPGYEGLYMPKILGFAVLRGEVNERYKYRRPQNHFKAMLMAISESANFEVIKQRIGQSIQIGFALSSDIWITNLIEKIVNKRVKYFLESQKIEKYRDLAQRRLGLLKYKKQFASLNFQSATFPTTATELKLGSYALNTFLQYRSDMDYDNSSLTRHIKAFLSNEDFLQEESYLDLLMTIGMRYDLGEDEKKLFSKQFDKVRKANESFSDDYFVKLEILHKSDSEVKVNAKNDKMISPLIPRDVNDEVGKYYDLMDVVHSKGYIHEDAIEAVRTYYDQHEGLSNENECVRSTIFRYFAAFLENLDTNSYSDYFEINKVFTIYMSIFSNQKFNQHVKDLSLRYIKKLLKAYTDKRGRDYQDIKKFVKSSFSDLGFMSEKELVELFKTKRKRRKSSASA